MGLFSKMKKQPLRTEDEILMVEGMLAVSMADGDDQWEESELIRAFMNTLPELKDKDTYEIYEAAEKNVKLHGAMSRVDELKNLSTDAMKKKTFLLAMDVALSSGDIDDGEEAVLGKMQQALEITDDDAQSWANVLMVKYSS
jgi:tellurite resistance protein